jgi:hypothetical protein
MAMLVSDRPEPAPKTAPSVPYAPLAMPTRRMPRQEIQLHGLQRLRRGCGRERRRQHRDAVEDAADHEQDRRANILERDHHLTRHDAEERDGDIQREDCAAALVCGALVQPALDDHRGAGRRKTGDGAQQHPPDRVDDNAADQRDDRDNRNEAGEGTDMANAAHQFRRDEATDDEAGSPGRAEQAERGCRVAFQVAANRKQDALQPIAHEEKQRPEEKRGDGQQISFHIARLYALIAKTDGNTECRPASR